MAVAAVGGDAVNVARVVNSEDAAVGKVDGGVCVGEMTTSGADIQADNVNPTITNGNNKFRNPRKNVCNISASFLRLDQFESKHISILMTRIKPQRKSLYTFTSSFIQRRFY